MTPGVLFLCVAVAAPDRYRTITDISIAPNRYGNIADISIALSRYGTLRKSACGSRSC
jgi:hypothetical protein